LGEDSFTAIKTRWRMGQYESVIGPLLDLRDSAPNQTNFEADYMLAIALNRVPRTKEKGCDYLSWMRFTYRGATMFDQAKVDINRVYQTSCPAAVTSNRSESDGPGVVSSPQTGVPNPQTVRNDARRQLRLARGAAPAVAPPPEIPPPGIRATRRVFIPTIDIGAAAGTYSMVHDGWKGKLVLGPVGSQYVESNGTVHAIVFGPIEGYHFVFYVIGLGGENADGKGGQKFDAYLMTQTTDALAGVTYWSGRPFGFYAIKQQR
jgi:hypothetical protein